MMKIGQKITVYYPFDACWWNKEGIIIDKVQDDLYLVQDSDGNKVQIDILFLKERVKSC